jgi:PPOX class probable F420-dependent enzyme
LVDEEVRIGMELDAALDFARSTRQSVLTTIRKNGRPQLSNVAHHVGEDGAIRISITATRAKYVNLQREPWAALHVTAPDFWSYVVIEGDVTLTPIATSPDDPSIDQLVELYRAMAGEHPDWDDYRRAMVEDQRTVLRITPTRAYGMLGR